MFPSFPLSPDNGAKSGKQFGYLRLFQSRLARYLAAKDRIIAIIFYVYLYFTPQGLSKISELLTNEVAMLFLLEIECTDQLGKLQRLILRLADNRYRPLTPPCSEYHKKQNGKHGKVQSPAKSRLRQEIPERRLLFIFSFGIGFRAIQRQVFCQRKQTENISGIVSIQHPVVGKQQGSGNKNDFSLSHRTTNSYRTTGEIDSQSCRIL